MVVRSRHLFGSAGGSALLETFKRGWLPSRSFHTILMVQFVVATGFLIALNEVRYVDHELGLAAYEGHNTTRFDARFDLIEVCGWRDLYPYDRIGSILYGDDIPLRDPNVDLNTDDPRIVDFNAFMSDLESQFRSQAPDAIRALTDRLNPVFAILSAFFLVVARAVLQSKSDDQRFPL